MLGTVPYMAPEQIEGREVDARTDIFAFGVLLYEMVAGRPPFKGDSRAALMAAIVAADPPSLADLQPPIPGALERLIRRCLAKAPEQRWSGYGLAWAPSGRTVWFTATRGGVTQADGTTDPTRAGPQLQAVSLAGVVRPVDRTPDWLVIHDIAPDGTALLSRNTIRISMSCQTPSDTKERDLSWLTASVPRALSPDGASVIFIDFLAGRTASGNPTVFRRGLDGAAAVAIGEGAPHALSPDGQWVLTRLKDDLVLLPMGAGEKKTLQRGDLGRLGGGGWLSNSTQVVFRASLGEGRPRVYRQTIPDGAPVAITPEGTFSGPAAVRDDRTLLLQTGNRWVLYPVGGGVPEPVSALTARDLPVAWSDDGRFLYAVEINNVARPARFDVFRIDVANGRRDVWKTLEPEDTAGVETNPANFRMLPDGGAYCYSYMRRLGDLFVVQGLR